MLMRSAYRLAIGLAASALFFVQPHIKAATEGTTAFDGTWAVTVDFHAYKNPDGTVAKPTVRRFVATVKKESCMGKPGPRVSLTSTN